MTVSQVAYGTSPFGQLFGPVPFEQARAALLRALELGVTFIDTSPYYGDAEERLGRLSNSIPDDVIVGTKAGRYGFDEFDFTPERIRSSVDESLRRLRRDHVDILQLHDIDFGDLDRILTDSYDELVRLRDAGKCRAIGMTCYSVAATRRVLLETDVDVVLNFAHGTLLDDSLDTALAPLARDRGVGVMNAAAVALGLLTPRVLESSDLVPMATPGSRAAARSMAACARDQGASISMLANQYAMQQIDCDTTLIGTTKLSHLEEAVAAAETPIDAALARELVGLRAPIRENQWNPGRPE
ncbi:aldo/keto reductase [Leucobacter japonicus]|uniref:aldo/keto reductase n=1 Tax=Leucobacter japonicus TaxID=1461259 RepID=UPI001F4C827B|nr:aldo/keto reductase [Leucobacter japonicus]